MNRRLLLILAGSLAAVWVLAMVTLAASVTDFSLVWHVIAGGGGRVSSSDYVLGGSIGQPAAGDLASADYGLGGGFWPGIGAAIPSPTVTGSPPPTSTPTATPTPTPTMTGSPPPTSTPTPTSTPSGTVSPTPAHRVYLPIVLKSHS